MSDKCIDMPLGQGDINICIDNLQGKISSYNYRALGVKSDDTLIRLKAMDTVKDGASPQLAMAIFNGYGEIFNQSDCTSLPSKIKTHFDTKVTLKQLKYLSYTRIKSRGNQDVIMEGFNCDCIIPDCGPLYGPGNGKTPVIKRVGGVDDPRVKYSLGNMMDSGPSSSISNSISDEFKGTYDIPPDIMNLLGYPNCSISVENSSPSIYIDDYTNAVANDMEEFKKHAAGNKSKGELLNDSNTKLPHKKKLLYFKSLGDGLIVFFWYVYCLKIRLSNLTCALLTCDSVVALQADIFSQSQPNAYFAWNFTEKGEKHISRVYAKCGEPIWRDLCGSEKQKLDDEYHILLQQIETIMTRSDIIVSMWGDDRDIIDAAKVLFEELEEAVRTLRTVFNSLYEQSAKDEELFNKLKSYALNSPIKKIEVRNLNRFFLKYPHTKLCSAGPPCYIVNKKKCNLHAKIRSIQLQIADRNNLNALLDEEIEGGRNPFHDNSELDEPFLVVDALLSYDTAIKFLKEFILNVLEDIIDSDNRGNRYQSTAQFEPELIFQGKFWTAEKEKYVHDTLKHIMTSDENFLYEYLTYEFHAIPDYSSDRITTLCTEVVYITIESYNIILELKSKAKDRRREELRREEEELRREEEEELRREEEEELRRADRSHQSQETTPAKTSRLWNFITTITPWVKSGEKVKMEGGRKTRRIRKNFTLKHKKRSMRKTQRRRNIIK